MSDSMTSMQRNMMIAERSTAANTAAWNRTTVNTGATQREQLEDVAKEFEAAFLAEFLKQGRAGELAEGMFSSEAGKTFQSMLDVEVARSSSRGLNLGIADAMVEQLSANMPSKDK